MARRAHAYPQVEPGAAALVDAVLPTLRRGATSAEALALLRKRDAGALWAAGGSVVLREDLGRAERLGLGDLDATDLARPVPAVGVDASEVSVRRHLAAGAPLVVVQRGRVPVGAAAGRAFALVPRPSMAAHLGRHLSREARRILDVVAGLASAHGARAYLVGGVVRDLLRGQARSLDLDIVVEGDAPALAEALARDAGGTVLVHERFLTASVRVPFVGDIDVVTSRSERYEVPGALPRVMPAPIGQDLVRRDFTINAMAIELDGPAFTLLDPLGGRSDLTRRRVRALHPLSFVEDPTRVFRAARYAARFGFALDAWTERCQRLALGLAPYPALSGRRIVAEIEHLLGEARPDAALGRLGRSGAFRLIDPAYRFTARTAARLRLVPHALGWARDRGEGATSVELTVLALVADQRPGVIAAALRRLGFTGEPLARLERAVAAGRTVPDALHAARTPSARARLLRDRGPVELEWLRLAGAPATSAAVDEFLSVALTARPALRGDELLALGVPRGPEIGRVLDELRDARIDGVVHDRQDETAYVARRLDTTKEA
jgi:tRNA nucleotidyltransferase (CCA-adding enzyme)